MFEKVEKDIESKAEVLIRCAWRVNFTKACAACWSRGQLTAYLPTTEFLQLFYWILGDNFVRVERFDLFAFESI